ncbi:MvaI/BcnI family restriction endonuclease [Pseudomonas sp. PB3P13]
MSGAIETPLEQVSSLMRSYGAKRVLFKLLANNDNSKQQIYFGSDFDVLRLLPHGDLVGEPAGDRGLMYKAPISLSWVSMEGGDPTPALGAQLILYPKYPEVRLSGFLRGSALAPSKLMSPPSPEERATREGMHRCLILGICEDDTVLAYCGTWDGLLSRDANFRINKGLPKVASVFYELEQPVQQGRILLLNKLSEIYRAGPIRSCRLNSSGQLMEYQAKNGAGYTLESLFGIMPNGRSEPDFHEWELKSHSSGAVTLMTPEPDSGIYREDLAYFLNEYGRNDSMRRDFTGRHLVNSMNKDSQLTLRMEGYDPLLAEVIDPEGGIFLRDRRGVLAAGWSFNKILTHWSRKHSNTAYVSYSVDERDVRYYHYGPNIYLCSGAGLKPFLQALYGDVVYYDPGVNMKLGKAGWVSKKRNQFRVGWKNINQLYNKTELIVL